MIDVTGEITAAAPIASYPFTAPPGRTFRCGRRTASRPRTTDFILTAEGPRRHIVQSVDTGTSPEILNRTYDVTGT